MTRSLACMLTIVLLADACPGQVELRGQRQPLDAEVLAVDMAGVRVREPGGDGQRTIAWHRVRNVNGEWAGTAERFQEYAEKSWRAAARLQRGDAIGAEPLFEELFTVYEDRDGATAAVVAEGLLACRLRRGARVAAVRPWLVLLRAEAEGGLLDEPLIDPELGLVPTLPPMWIEASALENTPLRAPPLAEAEGLHDEVEQEEAEDADAGAQGPADARRARTLGDWYHYAARRAGGADAAEPTLSSSDPAVALVASIVRAADGDAEIRSGARRELRRIMGSRHDSWVEAWCRAAIGRSLIRETDREDRMRGVVSLLHVPARFGSAQPHLAGLCLADAAVTLDELGDAAGARRVLSELERGYPRHPALESSRVRSLRDSGGGSGAAGASGTGHRG